MIDRRAVLAGLLSAPALGGVAVAQNGKYPNQPIRLIVGTEPGASLDLTARTLATQLANDFKSTVVVENRPGANSAIATAYVSQAAPDGYTLQVTAQSIAVNPNLMSVGYDIATISAVSLIATVPQILVVQAGSAYKDVTGLIAAGAANPGVLNYGSSGLGSPPHLAAQLFDRQANIACTHIPYKGATPALTDLLGGRLDFMFGSLPLTKPHIESGKLRPLGIAALTRSALAPDIPTISEMGLPGYASNYWVGLVAPPNMPRDVVALLDRATGAAMAQPHIERMLETAGMEVSYRPSAEFALMLRDATKRFAEVLNKFK